MRYSILIFLLIVSISNFATPPKKLKKEKKLATLIGIQVQNSKKSSHFTFILSAKIHGSVRYLPHPDRLLVQLNKVTKQFRIQNLKINDPNVYSISELPQKNNHLYFVFFLKTNKSGSFITRQINWKFYYLPQTPSTNWQLRLDIDQLQSSQQQLRNVFKDDICKTFSKLAIKAKKIKPEKNSLTNWLKSKPNSSLGARKMTIVIDPGHGGKDPGARGIAGKKEKDIVLAIAKQLSKEINQTENMRAILTRTGDYFVSLRKRLDLAREQNADLFIAIHADAYFNNHKSGASVFALSKRGATSEAARWLAKRDNYSELGEVELNELQDRSSLLRGVLIDLSQTATIRDSLRLGNKVLDALDNVSSLHYKYVEQAPFVVLKSPDIPSILVETGFISNPYEEARLANPIYQQKMAHALWQGIQRYKLTSSFP